MIHRQTSVGVTLLSIGLAAAGASAAGGEVLVADFEQNRVIRYEVDNGAPVDHFIADCISPLADPHSMTIGPDGRLYVSSFGSNTIERYDLESGQHIDTFVPRNTSVLNGPTGLAFDDEGRLYVASYYNDRIIRYRPSGLLDDILVADESFRLDAPRGLIFAAGGESFYVVSSQKNSVLHYGRDGNLIDTPIESGDGLVNPYDLALGPDDRLYVTSMDTDAVLVDALDGTPPGLFVTPGSGDLDGPAALEFAPDGSLWVASWWNRTVRRYDGSTGAPRGAGIESSAGCLGRPSDLLFLREFCVADVTGDGIVDFRDVLLTLANWGLCP